MSKFSIVLFLLKVLVNRETNVALHLQQHWLEKNKRLRKVVKFSSLKNKRFWSSLYLLTITFTLVIVVAPGPVLAQFTPPTANGSTGITCIGFFCNIAQKINANALFTPIGSATNGLVTVLNVALGGYYMNRGYSTIRKIERNQEEWKQDAWNIGTSLGLVILIYVISLAFVSGGGT